MRRLRVVDPSERDEDPLGPARGCLYGVIISIVFVWLPIWILVDGSSVYSELARRAITKGILP